MPTRKPPSDDVQLSLFSAVFTDISTRDAQDMMELPFLSLSKKPRLKPITYHSNGVEIFVTGGPPLGIANIWDWDLIMWLLSQVRQSLDVGHSVSRKIRFNRRVFLKNVRRDAGGAQYKSLEQTIARLQNTSVRTTVRAGQGRRILFSWLEYAEIERDEHGRLRDALVVIPEWLFEAVCNKRLVLTLHADYFLLTGGVERWLYRFIRKGAGATGWSWTFRTLYERSGSTRRFSDFAVSLRSIVTRSPLLDYGLSISKQNGQEVLTATKVKLSKFCPSSLNPDAIFLSLKTTTYDVAKKLLPGCDVYAVEADWKEATQRNGLSIKNPDQAFLGWCRKVAGCG